MTAAACPVRYPMFPCPVDGRLTFMGPVPTAHAPGKVFHLDTRRPRRATASPTVAPLPAAIHEAAVEALTMMLRAELHDPDRVDT